MRHAHAVCWAVLLCLSLLVGAARADLAVGDRPRIDIRTMEGQRITNDELRGRIVIMEFWATWCGPCVQQVPHLREVYAKVRDQGVVMISLSRDQEAGVAKRFAERNRMVWTQVHDMSQTPQLAPAWGVSGIPHAFIFSPEGELLWRGHPASMDKPLEEAIRKHPPRAATRNADTSDADAAVVEAALAALIAARDAATSGDFAALAKHVAALPAESLSDRRVIGQGRVLLMRLKTQPKAKEAIDAAIDADAGFARAWSALTAAVAPRAADSGAALFADADASGPKPQLVAAKLAQAEKFRERGQHHRAWKAYEWLIEHAGDSDAGRSASERVAAYAADAEIMAAIRAEEAEGAARSMYAMASSYEQAGKKDLARDLYQRILDRYGDTATGARAKERMASLD